MNCKEQGVCTFLSAIQIIVRLLDINEMHTMENQWQKNIKKMCLIFCREEKSNDVWLLFFSLKHADVCMGACMNTQTMLALVHSQSKTTEKKSRRKQKS